MGSPPPLRAGEEAEQVEMEEVEGEEFEEEEVEEEEFEEGRLWKRLSHH